MADVVSLQPFNFRELQRALRQAPDVLLRFIRTEWGRAGKRWRKAFIRERLSGSPGIRWRKKSTIGRNVRGDVVGKSLGRLQLRLAISRFLRVHEEGATIRSVRGDWLFLQDRKAGEIIARVKSVTIPARLGYRPHVERFVPDLMTRTQSRSVAAVRVAMERRMQAGAAILRGVTGAR